jgi:hypothetical protein
MGKIGTWPLPISVSALYTPFIPQQIKQHSIAFIPRALLNVPPLM